MLLAPAVLARSQDAAPSEAVLVDASGSMKGFFYKGAGQAESWMGWLEQQISREQPGVEKLYFIDEESLTPSVGRYGNNTFINSAFTKIVARNQRPSIVWFVTDNQPSSPAGKAASDDDLRRFYDNLQSDAVKRIYFFPLRLPYSGDLYLFDENDTPRTYPNYNGNRGLVVYALLLDDAAAEPFERAVAEVESRLAANDAAVRGVRAKPLDRDFASLAVRQGERFTVTNEGVVGENFSVGEPIVGNFFVDLTSTHGEIEISKAKLTVEPVGFESGDFTESNIVPVVTPDEIENFAPQNTRTLTINLRMEPVQISSWLNVATIMRTLNENEGYIRGNIRLRVRVPPQNFKLVSQLTSTYSAGDRILYDARPDLQERVYRLDGLVQRMTPAQGTIDIQPEGAGDEERDIPVRIAVLYPKKPLGLVLTLLLLLLLIPLLLILWFKRQPFYRLAWENGRKRACPDFRLWPLVGKKVELDDCAAASIRRTPLSGIKVSAARGYVVDEASSKMLNPDGSDFNLSRKDDGAGVNFYFSKAGGAAARASVAADDPFGGTSYGGGGGNAGDVGGDGAAPVERPSTGRAVAARPGKAPGRSDDDLDSLLG